MKKTLFTLLAVTALALIGYCCHCWWKDDGLSSYYDSNFLMRARLKSSRRNRNVPRLREELGISNFRGPSERYIWKSPSSISISNQTFKISNVEKNPRCEAYTFDVGNEVEGVLKRVCHCRVVVARNPEAVHDFMLENVVVSYMFWPVSVLVVELDEKGNVLVSEKTREEREVNSERGQNVDSLWSVVDPARFKRTYGNIYMRIDMEREAKDVPCAKDFALPLLEAGASKRFSIFGR